MAGKALAFDVGDYVVYPKHGVGRVVELQSTEIAGAALDAANTALTRDGADDERVGDPGYHLIGEGRLDLERSLGFRPPLGLRLSRFHVQLGIVGYVGAILLVTTLLLSLGLQAMGGAGVGAGWLALLALVAFLPITDLASALVNRVPVARWHCDRGCVSGSPWRQRHCRRAAAHPPG